MRSCGRSSEIPAQIRTLLTGDRLKAESCGGTFLASSEGMVPVEVSLVQTQVSGQRGEHPSDMFSLAG